MGFFSALFGPPDLNAAIENLFARQRADAAHRGPMGNDVYQALNLAQGAIYGIAPDKIESSQLQELADAVRAQRPHLRTHTQDEAGYGAATLHEIAEGIEGLK